MTAEPNPGGLHAVHAMLAFRGAAEAILFYQNAFGATELSRLVDPRNGAIGHAQIKIGASVVMLSDETAGWNQSPQTLGGTTVILHLAVPDVDATVEQAVQAGATLMVPVQDQFYGERSGRVRDPYGYIWLISTHKEDVTLEEMQRRFNAMMNPVGDS